MTEIEAIRERHSVRNYIDKPIEADKIAALNEMLAACNKEGNVHFQLCVDAGDTYTKLMNKFMGLGSAPSVIACVGPDDETLDERIGYYGERIVLFAQTLGLNTCWAGTFNRKKMPVVVEEGERIVISIAIGYGVNNGKERKSKTVEQVSSANAPRPEWFEEGVKAALLAPTAINQQKFEIVLKEDDTVEFIDKGGVMSKVDIGIVKYHFEVGAQQLK